MASVASLWIGPPLSLAHKIALSSFVFHGHEVTLYVYDMNIDVPNGVLKVDANNIINSEHIFKHFDTYAAFSDLFRYEMIIKTGQMWVDTDMFCFSDNFFDQDEYVFVEESKNKYCGNLLKLPKDGDFAKWLCYNANEIAYKEKVEDDIKNFDQPNFWEIWTYIGPYLLTKGIEKYSLQAHSISKYDGHIVDIHTEDPRDMFWSPKYRDITLNRIKNAVSGTFFNSWLDQREFDKNNIVENSAIDFLYRKYFLGDTIEIEDII